MNDDFNEYQDLIRRMEAMPQVTPPSDFTQKVMGRLSQRDEGFLFQWEKMAALAGRAFNFGWSEETGAVNKKTCSFYYFISGLFYLIIGIVAIVGIRKISAGGTVVDWIGLQPLFALGTAIWFFAIGGLIMMDGRAGVKAAEYGTMCYIFTAVVNGIILLPYLRIPYAGFFVFGLAATSVFMGVMLVQALQKMELRPI